MNKLEGLIKKNIKRGWDEYKGADVSVCQNETDGWTEIGFNMEELDPITLSVPAKMILLSHDFAKSWFGNGLCPECKEIGDEVCSIKAWRHHLQCLILLKTVKEMVNYYWENK